MTKTKNKPNIPTVTMGMTAVPQTAVPVLPGKTLYDISREFSELEDLLSGIEGDISADQQKQIDEFLAGLEEDRDKKIDAYCGLIRDLEARAEARKREADRFAQLARFDANKVARLKWVLLNFMQTHRVERIETVRFRLRRAANAAPKVELGKWYLEHPEDLEERFRLTVYKPNLKEIAQALKDGEPLDFASFGEKGENLRIE